MPSKTRRARKPKGHLIQHHHLIIRVELQRCPGPTDVNAMEESVDKLIKSINMAHLAPAKVYYMKEPKFNEGMTCIAPIKTSHLSFHFWKRPEKSILNNPDSKCLLQMDVYTCGSLNKETQKKVLSFLEEYNPTHLNFTLLDRLRGMKIDKTVTWDSHDCTFDKFLNKY